MTIHDATTRRRVRNVARAGAVGSAIMLAITGLSWLPAAGAASFEGPAQVIDPSSNQALTTGGSSTNFTLQLPSQAACTGDSTNSGYRVQSYMVPANVDPATLQYGSQGPTPQATGANFRQPLFDTSSTPYVNAQTADQTVANGPGQIINIPAFNFEVFNTPPQIPDGTYNVGISCTKGPQSTTQVDKFWNVQLTITADPADSPAQIKWTVASTNLTTTTTSGSTTTTAGGTGNTTTTTGSGTTATTSASTATTTAAAASAADPSAGGGSSSGNAQVGGTSSDAGNSASSGSGLPNTGGRVAMLLVWAGLLAIFGRMAVLMARPVRQRRAGVK